MRFVVLGSNGMLGSELVRVATLAGFNLLATSRFREPRFDAFSARFLDFAEAVQLSDADFVVNAIGWIPQKASGDEARDQREARLLNDSLMAGIASSQRKFGFRWLQIGTDCVFSGASGGYSENSIKDAQDLYGRSKVEGETHCGEAMLVRSSIVGPDQRTNAGLYAWFKSQKGEKEILGFNNHLWNGVTTTAFARLAVGLAKSDVRQIVQHWTPDDVVTKVQLLRMFAANLGVSEDVVKSAESSTSVDRTLVTLSKTRNSLLWLLAGYDGVPTIAELVSEMVEVDLGRE